MSDMRTEYSCRMAMLMAMAITVIIYRITGESLMTNTETMEYSQVVVNRLARLAKLGGTLNNQPAKKGDDLAAIGENQGVHFVMYPDDTVDRFEKNEFVKYRSGWTGPTINDEASLQAARNEVTRLSLQAASEAKERKKRERQAKKNLSPTNSDVIRQQRYDIKIPDNFVDITDSMRPAFDFFFEKFGELINRQIGTSTREIENWNDPEYVLDAVMERMHDYLGLPNSTGEVDGEGPEMTPEEYLDFKELDRKYQLAIAYQYCGMLPY